MISDPYLKRTPTGWYSYRRRVPAFMREEHGLEFKRTLKTKDLRQARAAAAIHDAAVQNVIDQAKAVRDQRKAYRSPMQLRREAEDWLRAKGYSVAPKADWSGTDNEDEWNDRLIEADYLEDQLQEGKSPDPAGDEGRVRALRAFFPKQVDPVPTIMDAVQMYLEGTRPANMKKKRTELERYAKYLTEALGGDRPIDQIKHNDAIRFRDQLERRGLQAESVNTAIGRMATIISYALKVNGVHAVNALIGTKVRISQAERQKKRQSFKPEILKAVLALMKSERADLATVFQLMVWTGARNMEIGGLAWEDIQLEGNNPHLWIRPNECRGHLKTSVSERCLPMVGEMADALNAYANSIVSTSTGVGADTIAGNKTGAVFPRLVGDTDGLSRGLNRIVRKISMDKKLVAYSLRHTVKDWAREARIPRAEAEAIFGREGGGSGSTYGMGYTPEMLREPMEAIADVGRRWLREHQ